MNDEYRISHITDLAQIPPEHWDEMTTSLRMALASAGLMHAALVASGSTRALSELCPVIVYRPDGVSMSTMDLGDGRSLVIHKDQP